jgi:hypothetical protein
MTGLVLSQTRVRSAYAAAVATDLLQLALGPLGWMLADEILDIVAMVVISRLIGFHPLLLPTFVLELVPVADLLPTWTGAVALVMMFRRKQAASEAVPPAVPDGPVIDV